VTPLPDGFALEAVDVRSADDAVLRAMFAVAAAIEREDLPEPPWVPEGEWVAELRADAGIQDRSDRLVRGPDGQPVGVGHFWATRSEENRHRARLVVQVVPAARRRGIGAHLLAEVANAGLDAGRTRVQTWTTAAGPGAGGRRPRLHPGPSGVEAGVRHLGEEVRPDATPAGGGDDLDHEPRPVAVLLGPRRPEVPDADRLTVWPPHEPVAPVLDAGVGP